jgi:glycosyltransferase involved in cell wall biosynthesis
MRIVMVYQHFMLDGVGSTKPYDMARLLVRAGHEVTVICGRGYLAQGTDVPRGLVRRLRFGGVEVVCMGVDYRQRMGFARRIASFLAFTLLSMLVVLRLPRYDVLLASSTPLTVGLTGLVSWYLRRTPYVFEIRDLWPEVPFEAGFLKSRLLLAVSSFFEKWFYRKAAAVCAISRRMCDRLVARGVPAGKVHFIPTGVDVAAFDAEPDREFLRRHGLEGAWVAVYLGAHGRVNGLDYLLDAADELKGRPGIRIVLIGDGSEKPRLEAEAGRRGLESVLRFLPPVPRGTVPGILKACDAMLMINRSGPGMQYVMPNKFFDYLASGRPLVSNVDAELTGWVREADCGLVAKPDDPADLARALERLRADPQGAREMGDRARALAADRFDRRRLVVDLEKVLAAAAGLRPEGAGPPGSTDEGDA